MKTRTATCVAALVLFSAPASRAAEEFAASFPEGVERPWAGRQLWANPMEDWRVAGGRLEAVRGGHNRNVHVLTRSLGSEPGSLEMSAVLGRADDGKAPGSAGFRVGIRSELGDYRSAIIYGQGLDAGIAPNGGLFIGAWREAKANEDLKQAKSLRLRLTARPVGDGYALQLTAEEPEDGKLLATVRKTVPADRLTGSLALVNNFGTARRGGGGPPARARFWFDDWKIAGTKVRAHEDRAWGPILWAMHTLSRGVMKMTAQMPPLAASDSQTVRLEIERDGEWRKVAEAPIDPLSRTATLRVEDWDSRRDTPYRLVYTLAHDDTAPRDFHWTGTVRREPVGRPLVVAGFTGNTDRGFPNADVVRNVGKHNPDVMVFTGDQIYENVGGYGIHRGPVELATLNYLRKWYLLGWAFGDLMRDRVTLCLPDDHDVYQGNIWGNGGNPVLLRNHEAGGYVMPPQWVNAVQRTQTSHHPDPYDATPIKQGITVYYGDMLYGRVSFAIIEDRKFKSGPRTVATWSGRPDHVKDPNFDPASVDKPGLKLLGDRQLKFLRHWSKDWRGADLKIVCSQTIFCNLANYHGAAKEFLVADLDSNGWPQSGRNRALEEMRRGLAFHLAGDQHLPSIVHHGIEAHGDAGYSFCVPSIAAGYPRSWRPDQEGRPVKNRVAGLPNTGDYRDGLGNVVTVYAIGNPETQNRPGVLNTLHDKASGYGIVRLDPKTRKITIECWRLQVDVDDPKPEDQFPGWPKTIDMQENDGRRAAAHLPTVKVSGMENPVLQVIDEADGDILYTLRIAGTSFRPKVFRDGGSYTIRVGEQETGNMKTLKGIKPAESGTLEVKF